MRPPLQWYQIAASRLERERSYLASLAFFALKRTYCDQTSNFIAIGILHYVGQRSGKTHTMTVRLEYPRGFPKKAQYVFDHDRMFAVGSAGHLLGNHELCLTLTERGEFSLGSETLTEEVLGATLVWFHKRLIFERSGEWPGPAERHGINAVLDLLVERHTVCDIASIRTWLQRYAVAPSGRPTAPDLYAPCPCGSGNRLKFCHREELKPLFDRLSRVPADRQLSQLLDVK